MTFHSVVRETLCWIHRCKVLQPLRAAHSFCSSTNKKNPTTAVMTTNEKAELAHYKETYNRLDNLDFMTAAKILFTDPPKKKKFGLDFHLVQLFFACLPSLAVYLVAQYARAEMKEMDLELEKRKQEQEQKAKESETSNIMEDEAKSKRKQEQEQKAKESEIKNIVEGKAKSDPELSEVKVRLDKLEEAIKEIAIESKRQSSSRETTNQVEGTSKKHHETVEQSRSESNKSFQQENLGQKKADKNQKDDTQDDRPSQ